MTDIVHTLRSLTIDDVFVVAFSVLASIGAIVTACTPLVPLLRSWANGLRARVAATATKADDRFVAFLDRTADVLEAAAAWLPRITNDVQRTKDVVDKVRRRPPNVPPALSVILLILLPLGLGTGCAGGQHVDTIRSTLLIADGAVDRVDRDVEPLYQAAHERAQAEAADRADYERRMQRWNRVDAAIEGVQVSLRSAALTLETVAEGVAGEVLASIACAVESLTVLADLLPLVGVEVPPTVRTVITLLRGFSAGACPAPPQPEPEPPASPSLEVTS